MKLDDVLNRKVVPIPWDEGDNIPWNDPDFSKRMLREHLSQEHDAASRKNKRIDQHVAWIHDHVLKGRISNILDLCCGPGLYSHRLSKLGHKCHGIDYSPASISYAKRISREEGLDCTFQGSDVRNAEYGNGYAMVTMIFGEFNVFRPTHAQLILGKAFQALDPGGILLLEPHTFEAVQTWGNKTPSWYSSSSGLNSPDPHLVLEEYFWDPDDKVTTNRYFIIDVRSGNVTRYAQSVQAYTHSEYRSTLEKSGYTDIHFYPSLIGEYDHQQTELMVILARKPMNVRTGEK